ncbi:CYTH-like domain-containing protein [Pyronema omphalodes]|nr:CYTH-like domain-containing protein [Pyronema omphalodes]
MSPPSTATAPSSNPKPASPPSPKSQQPPNNQQPLRPPPTPTQMVNTSDGQSGSPGSSGPPRKRPRGGEAPIWARKASRSSSSSPVMAARRQPPNSVHVAPQTQTPRPPQATSHPAAPPPTHPPASQQQPPIHQQARPAAPAVQPPNLRVPSVPHSWEPSIVNEKPYDEIIRRVADFLWSNVILRDDPALANTGPDAPVIEIEAKLGHIIDKTTNDRLRLPIASEAVLSNEDGLRMQFRSSMTEPQHRRANDFLNNVLQKSAQKIPDAPPRVPLTYRHIREVDSFYELPADQVGSLPEIVRQNHNPRMQMRVRVTRDQKTQEVVRKLIKTRVADLNIHYPSASFDVRISINIETPYTGDIEGLVAITGTPGSGDGSRSKDRLSYSHLAYHVDLTQVTDKFGKKEHELEVEINGTELRRQGLRARDGERNHFEKMVEGFVDNVRVLTRHLSP